MTTCDCAQGSLCPEGERLRTVVKGAEAAKAGDPTAENYRATWRAHHAYNAHIAAATRDHLKQEKQP